MELGMDERSNSTVLRSQRGHSGPLRVDWAPLHHQVLDPAGLDRQVGHGGRVQLVVVLHVPLDILALARRQLSTTNGHTN